MTKTAIKDAPTFERFAASTDPAANSRVDRQGGRYGSGLISGVSICSRGEALGHRLWCDPVMLQQVLEFTPTDGKLLKSRFTHPGLCSDGMGKALGTIENVTVAGDQVYGDLHFYGTAHNAPDGDLAEYVMNFADEDPANFGLSIVFKHDFEAEEEFLLANGGQWVETEDGPIIIGFQSPDPDNVNNYPHARIRALQAADVVDEPAANPNGLFHRENQAIADGSRLLDFVLGRSTEVPALSALGVDVHPERVRSFVSNYLASAGLTVGQADPKGDTDMAIKNAKPKGKLAAGQDPQEEEKKPAETKPGETKPAADETKPTDGDPEPDGDESVSEDPKAAKPADGKMDPEECDDMPAEEETDANADPASKCSDPAKADLAKFCSTFGYEAGSKFYLEGVSFEAAQTKHISALTAERDAMKQKLDAFATSGIEPLKSRVADKKDDKKFSKANEDAGEIDDPRAAFARANATPTV